MIEGSEKCKRWLRLELPSSHVIERRSKRDGCLQADARTGRFDCTCKVGGQGGGSLRVNRGSKSVRGGRREGTCRKVKE